MSLIEHAAGGVASGQNLTALLSPRSIAVIGASPRPDTPGHDTLVQLRRIGYTGKIIPVNPKYEEIAGLRCVPSLAALDDTPDHAIVAVNNDIVEAAIGEAAARGIKAATIFASCYLENDTSPKLVERLAERARNNGMSICGANCMGFYNMAHRVSASWFPIEELPSGPIAFVSHSGAVFAAFLGLDRRLGYSLAVSAGQELTTTVADYLDYALDLEETRVAALFLETIRDPQGFAKALEKARDRDVPVVAVKVGRTSQSARLAESHSGAIAGNDAAYQALFDRYGVIRARDVDELAATATLLSSPKKYVSGGLAAITDSGGARGLLIDLADDEKVGFAQIGKATETVLRERLDYGLEPVNPLDAWGSGRDYVGVYRDCLNALMADPDTGIGMFLFDIALEDHLSRGFVGACIDVANATDKPVFVATNFGKLPRTELANQLYAAGIPLIDGVGTALRAVKHLVSRKPPSDSIATTSKIIDTAVVEGWKRRLGKANGSFDEATGYALVQDWGIATLCHHSVANRQELEQKLEGFPLPAVLKTAAPGILHKSDVGGVFVGLKDKAAVLAAYDDMAGRLGKEAILVEMAPKGVELIVGGLIDPQFGPIVMIGAGGILVELFKDVAFVLAPASREEIRRAIDKLKTAAILGGLRGAAAADIDAVVATIASFSQLVADLSEDITGIEINPLLATPKGCVPLDVLVTLKS
ncbi:acetate--CoA ligase family protein [Aminobacter carboxidus]|uniref:Acetate--CoA ligase family protein n=1 Tax=Aminobacter carboxidus TaxID=376165 RepID=A0ABR9GQU0_9HYPH|nr:acetate--CoA ligase family protein [Aminobacter carboxidus]MBE1206057.1 acetate--CoA ligase family protein [Aminobacter carboxidus]